LTTLSTLYTLLSSGEGRLHVITLCSAVTTEHV